MIDPATLRSLFMLRPGVRFLNHGSFGACPREVFEAYQHWQLELEQQPVEFIQRRADALLRDARATLGEFLGADADELVFVPNATFGLNVVARSIDLQPGDEVLTSDHEYGALDRAWTFVCEQRGAHYVRRSIPVPVGDPDEVVEQVWAGVTDRTRVLFLSHITSPTALILPIAPLIRRARDAGIITVIDGAHAPGQIPLDLHALDVDFYSGNCHKWMMAPKGSAFLYARRPIQELLHPLVVSWGWRTLSPGPSRFIDEHEYQGTRDLSAFLATSAAIEFMRRHDWPAVRQRAHGLLVEAIERITALSGLAPLATDSDRSHAQMAAIPVPSCDTGTIKRRLYDEYGIEVPFVGWNERTMIRVSVQGYTAPDEIDVLVGALDRLLHETTVAADQHA